MENHTSKPAKKLSDQVRNIIRTKNYSQKIEKICVSQISAIPRKQDDPAGGRFNLTTRFLLSLFQSIAEYIEATGSRDPATRFAQPRAIPVRWKSPHGDDR